MPKIMVKCQTVQTKERPHTNGRTHTHTDATKRIISPATRSIMKRRNHGKVPFFWLGGGLACATGRAAGTGCCCCCDEGGTWGFFAETPSVTDLSVMPWYVPIVSILKPSVSKTDTTLRYSGAMPHYTTLCYMAFLVQNEAYLFCIWFIFVLWCCLSLLSALV